MSSDDDGATYAWVIGGLGLLTAGILTPMVIDQENIRKEQTSAFNQAFDKAALTGHDKTAVKFIIDNKGDCLTLNANLAGKCVQIKNSLKLH